MKKMLIAIVAASLLFVACASPPKKIDPNPDRTKIEQREDDKKNKAEKKFDWLGFIFGWWAATP